MSPVEDRRPIVDLLAPNTRGQSRVIRLIVASTYLVGLSCPVLLSGCGMTGTGGSVSPISPVVSPTIATGVTGQVYGGQQPVANSTVQLWQVGTSGYGIGAAPLGRSTLTDANGKFSLTGAFNCTSAANGGASLVYITATGGNPGVTGNVNNTALSMMTALGACGSLNSSTIISINEVTTVASVYALAQFMGSSGGIGSYGTSNQGLLNAFSAVNNLVNTATGVALAVTPNGNGLAPQGKIDTIANMLAPCINSTGPNSTPCSMLFADTTPTSGVIPTNTVAAALNIALYPYNKVPQLLALPGTEVPFQPTVASANDWTLTIAYASGGSVPSGLAVDSVGNVWIANYGTGGASSSVSMMTPLGVTASNSPFSSATALNGVSAIALDQSNNAWLANHDNNSAAELASAYNGSQYVISALAGPLNAASLSSPSSVAVDASTNIWFVNNAGNSLTELNHGAYVGAGTKYSSPTLVSPQSIAFDISGNAWVSNTSGTAVTNLNTTAIPVPFTSYSAAGLTNPQGVAIDGASNVWVTDSTQTAVAKLDRNGVAVSPATGFTGGGLSGSSADAIDGNGNLWVADKAANGVTELSPSGTPLSLTTGFKDASIAAPVAVAIDSSGDVWVANSQPTTTGTLALTVSELIGAAAPAVTPLSQAVTLAQLGMRPGTPQPTANPGGTYSAIAGSGITFSGAASTDPNNESLTYAWSFGDGSLGSGQAPVHTYAAAGTYNVILTVTNADGRNGVARTTATIAAAAIQAPFVQSGGPYSGTQYSPVTFNGTGSYDPLNQTAGAAVLTFAWNFGDGSAGAGPMPVHTYASSGTFTVTIAVTTASGGTATVTTSAVIAAGTAAAGMPTANPGGPYTGAAGNAVTFNGSASSDPNGLALTYSWNFGDGGSSTVANPTYTYALGGTYSPALTVSNGTTQNTSSTVATISSSPVAAMVVNAGGPYTVAAKTAQMFDGTKTTNPSGRQLLYTWDFGDGANGAGPTPTHVYASQGVYTVSLSVTDGLSQNGRATTQATVTAPPDEVITANAGGPYQSVAGQAIIFDASSSSDNLGNALTYSWNFGDGSTGTGVQPHHPYTSIGSYTVTLTATSGSATSSTSVNVVVAASIGVTITSPVQSALFSTNQITVSGTTTQTNLAVTVNGVVAQVSGSSFTATGVPLREGVNLISATAVDGIGGVGTGVVSVLLDVTAPRVSITSPASGATLTTSQITVAGLVNDIVTGTVGSNNVTVTVNGQPAQVSNRSYLLSGLQLVPGSNTITVVATDNVGNIGQTTETIQLLPANSQLSLVKISGDSQTGIVQSVLPQPIVVQLLSASGTPVAGRPITFTVTRSDGVVEVMPTSAQTLTVNSNSLGQASVLFKLGTRTGLGINQVSATTPGAAGAALFTATSTTGPATQIHVVNGEGQRGLLGEQLAQGFQAIVQDAYLNPVPGVTVNFTSQGASDGTLDNPNPVTDANGKVTVNLTVGQQEGMNNYAWSGDFSGDTGNPVTFLASAYAPGPIANTSVSGTVYDNSGNPVANATVTMPGTSLTTVTNASGNFIINGAPVGTVTLTVDGSTATTTQTLPFLSFVLQDLPGQNNTIGKTIYLPSIDVNNAQTVGGSDPVTLTMAGVPGLSMTVAPNSVTFPDGSTVGKLSLSQVKSDLVPMEPPNGSIPNLIWTLQPAGAKFSVPVQVTAPNTNGLPPGYVTEMYQYDHDLEQFVSAGTAHVSADGSVIVSDPGFGITKAGWGLPDAAQNSPFGCVTSCNSTNPCITAKLSPSGCLCYKTPNVGAACGSSYKLKPAGGNSCLLPGKCDANGACNGGYVDATVDCSAIKPNFCDIGAQCNGHGACISTGKIPDTPVSAVDGAAGNLLGDESTFSVVSDKTFTGPFQKLMNYFGATDVMLTYEPIAKNNDTYTCCEATQTANALIEKHSVGGMWTITGPQFPVVIGAVPLGVSIFGAHLGVFLQPSGAVSGTLTTNNNSCTKNVCVTFELNPQVKLALIGEITYNDFTAQAALTGGFQATVSGGCGTWDATISSLPIATEGTLELPFGGKWNGVIVLYPSVVLASFQNGILPSN